MAHITKRNGRWQATYRDPSRHERTKTFDRKVDAERWLAEQTVEVGRGTWIDPSAGRVTFGDYARRWAAAQVWRPSTVASVAQRLDNHIIPYLGDLPIGALRPSDLQAWVKGRSLELAPGTVRITVQTLRSVLRAAVADRLIPASPADNLRLPSVEHAQVVPLDHQQVAALRAALPERYRAAATLGAGAGLRQGELFGLSADRVDFLRRTIRVDRQLVTAVAGPPSLGPVKTPSSLRTIPVPEVVLHALSAHLAAWPAQPDTPIFTTEDGPPVARNRAGRIWRRAATEAALPPGGGWHALRHYYASVLIGAGESVKSVQARLGHKSAAVTLDVYSHLWPADEDRTRSAVQAALENLADLPRTSGLPGN